MERLFRSLKTEWVPSVGYLTAQEAHRDISHYLMPVQLDTTASVQ